MKGSDRMFSAALRVLRGETFEAVAGDYGVTPVRIRQMLDKAVRVTDPDLSMAYFWQSSRQRRKGRRWIDLLRADADVLIPLVEAKMKEIGDD